MSFLLTVSGCSIDEYPPPPQTVILATPMQYKTWEEFMYEILFDVPPNQNPGAAPGVCANANWKLL